MPFVKYMLGIILYCYREFEAKITIASKPGIKRNSYDIVKAYADLAVVSFAKQDTLNSCPSLGSSSVESALKKHVEDGTLAKTESGKRTMYEKSDK